LRVLGFDVMTAADGCAAIGAFREHADEIAVVLLDMKMPGMGGEEVFVELRRIRADVPVVLSSGFTEEQASARLQETGRAGFIHKPYRLADLRRTLGDVLGCD
jgi:two-component system cell cycle sensor histidine kinase/response regulator CckA